MQYVGMTTRSLNERIREHINFSKKTRNDRLNYLYEHFNSENCGHQNITVKILSRSELTATKEARSELLELEDT